MCSNGSGDNCLIEQPTCNFSMSTLITFKSCFSPILNISSLTDATMKFLEDAPKHLAHY